MKSGRLHVCTVLNICYEVRLKLNTENANLNISHIKTILFFSGT